MNDDRLAGEHRLERRHEARVRVTWLEALRVSGQIKPFVLQQMEVYVVERRHEAVAQVGLGTSGERSDASGGPLDGRQGQRLARHVDRDLAAQAPRGAVL